MNLRAVTVRDRKTTDYKPPQVAASPSLREGLVDIVCSHQVVPGRFSGVRAVPAGPCQPLWTYTLTWTVAYPSPLHMAALHFGGYRVLRGRRLCRCIAPGVGYTRVTPWVLR